jgi:hypothetical protein
LTGTGCEDQKQAPSETVVAASEADVVRFCGDCHAYPKPETFPVDKWREEVVQGFQFYRDSGRTDLGPPDLEAVVSYYEQNAPQGLMIPLPQGKPDSGPVAFREVRMARVDARVPAISHIRYVTESSALRGNLVVSDMLSGTISKVHFDRGHPTAKTLHTDVPHPAHVEICDLDSDGKEDWLVSDLGSFDPADHHLGRLLWLRVSPTGLVYSSSVLLENVGRVADARPGDFDGDGDQDIVVAVFGWRQTGKLLWLEQTQSSAGIAFEQHLLKDQHGCSHVPIVDIDSDGDLDLIALFSQEFESIELFTNDGQGSFSNSVLFAAQDPSYGSSSIELVDLDRDDDLDLLYTNGDSFDSHLIKPYHSLQWLENTGGQNFEHHHLDFLPGAYGAKAGDLDNDGDLDIVVCAMTLNFTHNFYMLAWFEQTEPLSFTRHNLELSALQHACLELGDFDSDGDLDIATGVFEPRPVRESDWLSIWWNDGERVSHNSKPTAAR